MDVLCCDDIYSPVVVLRTNFHEMRSKTQRTNRKFTSCDSNQ